MKLKSNKRGNEWSVLIILFNAMFTLRARQCQILFLAQTDLAFMFFF